MWFWRIECLPSKKVWLIVVPSLKSQLLQEEKNNCLSRKLKDICCSNLCGTSHTYVHRCIEEQICNHEGTKLLKHDGNQTLIKFLLCAVLLQIQVRIIDKQNCHKFTILNTLNSTNFLQVLRTYFNVNTFEAEPLIFSARVHTFDHLPIIILPAETPDIFQIFLVLP